ncbi:MAG: DUF1778 domain-containing protein [Desulfobacteraceae bacterium]
MKTPSRSIRTSKLDLRLSQEAKQTLSAAARVAQCSVSQFVLSSALERAAETLAERQHFHLDAEQWEAFMTALETPPRAVPQLQKLLREPSPFDAPYTE